MVQDLKSQAKTASGNEHVSHMGLHVPDGAYTVRHWFHCMTYVEMRLFCRMFTQSPARWVFSCPIHWRTSMRQIYRLFMFMSPYGDTNWGSWPQWRLQCYRRLAPANLDTFFWSIDTRACGKYIGWWSSYPLAGTWAKATNRSEDCSVTGD